MKIIFFLLFLISMNCYAKKTTLFQEVKVSHKPPYLLNKPNAQSVFFVDFSKKPKKIDFIKKQCLKNKLKCEFSLNALKSNSLVINVYGSKNNINSIVRYFKINSKVFTSN